MHDRRLHPPEGPGANGAVEVWRVDLRHVGSEPPRLLSPPERERAARISNPARRALWMRGRGMLRVLLGGYLERPPRELQFALGRRGKPALAHLPGQPELFFNLSHSGPLALYAFTAAGPVGVDVELARRRTADEVALAERAFGLEPARRLRSLDAPARSAEFLRLWVRHEAALKCLGHGLARAAGSAELDALWIAEIDLGADAAAALCVQGGPLELRLLDWSAVGGQLGDS